MINRQCITIFLLIVVHSIVLGKICYSQSVEYDIVDTILNKASYFINRDSDSVKYYSTIAYNKAKKTGNHNAMIDAILKTVKSYIKSGNLIEAKQLCDSADDIASRYNLKSREIQINITRGNVYQSMGFYSEALEIFINLEKRQREPNYEITDTDLYYYTAMIYQFTGDYEKCYIYLNRSLQLAKNSGNDADLIPIYFIYLSTNTDIDTIQKYMPICDSLILLNPRLTYEEVIFRNWQAKYYKAIGKLSKSKETYNYAIKIAVENKFKEALSVLLNNYAYLLMAESKFDSARVCLDSALAIASQRYDLENEAVILDSYKDYFKKTKDFENALLYNELSVEKDKEFREKQKIKRSQYLTAIFETEQKEKEILQKENEISRLWVYIWATITILIGSIALVLYYKQKIKLGKSRIEAIEKGKSLELANAIIKAQDDERKRLAMDLHDGLGARLGTLRFSFDKFFSKHKNYEEICNSIVHIHQNIRDLSHQMLPTQLEESGLIQAIKDFITPINSSGVFHIQFDSNIDIRLSNKLEVNIYFVVYELINNALRHSKSKSIFVQLYKHDDFLNLSVENGGNWYNSDKKPTGIGIKNVKTRIEYLNGKLTIESGDSETIIMIEIPISKND